MHVQSNNPFRPAASTAASTVAATPASSAVPPTPAGLTAPATAGHKPPAQRQSNVTLGSNNPFRKRAAPAVPGAMEVILKLADLGDRSQKIAAFNARAGVRAKDQSANWAHGMQAANQMLVPALGTNLNAGRIEDAVQALTQRGEGVSALALPTLFYATGHIADPVDRQRATGSVLKAFDAIKDDKARDVGLHVAMNLFRPRPEEHTHTIAALPPRFSELLARVPVDLHAHYAAQEATDPLVGRLQGAFRRASENIASRADGETAWHPAQVLPPGFRPTPALAGLVNFVSQDQPDGHVDGELAAVLKAATPEDVHAVVGSLTSMIGQMPTGRAEYLGRAFDQIGQAHPDLQSTMADDMMAAVQAMAPAQRLEAMEQIAAHLSHHPADTSGGYPRPAASGTALSPHAETFFMQAAALAPADRLAVANKLERPGLSFIGHMASDNFTKALLDKKATLLRATDA